MTAEATSTPAAPAVDLADVHKKLGGKAVLDGLTFSIQSGEILAFIGMSGMGKSVTLKHIVGLMKPDRGTVRVLGVDMATASKRELEKVRESIGYLFQGAALLNSINVYENVALPLREHEDLSEGEIRDRVKQTLELGGLPDATEKMPAHLSGGMKKRVGLARAIVRHPKILLYDEPTAGLDPPIAARIGDLIARTREELGVTSILVTHEMAMVFRISDRVAMLHQGKLLAQGTPEEIQRSEDPLVRQFIEGQPEGPLDEPIIVPGESD